MCCGAWSLVWCSVVLCCGRLTYILTMHQGRFQKRSEVQCGDVGRRVEVRGRAKYMSDPSSHAAHQPHASQPTKWSRVEKSHANAWDRSPTGSTIHCLPRQAASSKQRRAKPKSTSTSESRSRSRSKRVVAGNQSPRGGEGKLINRSEQVGVDDMTGIISMAKCGR